MRREVSLKVNSRSALPDPAGTIDPVVYRCLKALNDLVSGGLFVDLNPENPREKEGVALGGRQLLTLARQGSTGDIDITNEEIVQNTEIDQSSTRIIDLPDFNVDITNTNSVLVVVAGGVITDSATEEVTLVTDVQYDSSTQQLQKKTITGRLITDSSETGWTLITGGQAVAET